MIIDKVIGTQSVILTLDVDAFLFEKLNQIVSAGFSVIELNTIDTNLLEKVIHEFPLLSIGAGNITNVEQLENCSHAGVNFITSPGFLPALMQTAAVYSINYLPSIATISEAMQAIQLGCEYVRVFPASLNLCSILNKCLPKLRLFPAEIEFDEVEHFLNLPAVAAVSILNPEIKQLRNINEAILA